MSSRPISFWPGVLLFAIALAGALILPPSRLVILNNIIVLALFAMSTNLLLGTGGLVSLGHGCFFGVGAYTVALAWFHGLAPFWVAALLVPAFGAITAFVVGAFALRSKLWLFALVTMAFTQLFYTIAQKAYTYTQGDVGLFGPMVPEALIDPRRGSLFIVFIATVAMLVLWRIDNSPLGLVLRAIRDNQRRTVGLGVNVYWVQLVAFTISGSVCAVAGLLAVVNEQAAYPGMLDWVKSGDPILVSVIGGMHAFLGPVLGAIVFQLGHDVIVQITVRWQLALGFILLVVVLSFPDGLAGLFRRAVWQRGWETLRNGGRSKGKPR